MQSGTVSPPRTDSLRTIPLARPRPRRLYDGLKRLVDILAALFGLALLSPLFLLVALLIKRDSPGPVFYRGPRLGKGGRVFKILKFRTMYERPESYDGPRVTAQGDARITPLGAWLRSTKLNELPQLWNVLVGEMSLVGPRPEDPEIGAGWPEVVRNEVLSVRPGITSPASVLYRNEEALLHHGNLMDAYLEDILPSKLRLDQLYVRNRSFWLDMDVILWTFLVLLPQEFARQPLPERLFLGPLSRLMTRYVSWFIVDLLVTFVALGVVGVFWRSFGPLNVGLFKSLVLALGFSILFSATCAFMGVNRIVWSQANFTDALDLLPALGLGTLLALLVSSLWQGGVLDYPGGPLPPALIVMGAGLAGIGFVTVRYRERLLATLAARLVAARPGAMDARERVLIVGVGEAGQFFAWWLQAGRAGSAFRVVGYVDDDLYKQQMRIRGANVLGRREDIPQLVRKYDIGIILFAIHNIPEEERRSVLEICKSTPARVVFAPDLLASLRHAVNGSQASGKTSLPGGPGLSAPPAPSSLEDDVRQDTASKPPAERVSALLAELEAHLEDGDLSAARQCLHDLRSSLVADEARSPGSEQVLNIPHHGS